MGTPRALRRRLLSVSRTAGACLPACLAPGSWLLGRRHGGVPSAAEGLDQRDARLQPA